MRKHLSFRNARRLAAGTLVVGVGVGVYQGKQLRDNYRNSPGLLAPSGPRTGFEKFKHKIEQKVEEIKEDLAHPDDLLGRIRETFARRIAMTRASFEEKWRETFSAEKEKLSRLEEKIEQKLEKFSDKVSELLKEAEMKIKENIKMSQVAKTNSSGGGGGGGVGGNSARPVVLHQGQGEASAKSQRKARKIKLLVLGDSLAVGIGCDDATTSPVFPRVLAKILNKCLDADVAWHSVGLSGATVTEVRTLVPSLRQGFLASSSSSSSLASVKSSSSAPPSTHSDGAEQHPPHVICVVICGLNDWKAFFERYGNGPAGFRKELSALAMDLSELGVTDIFVPALPSMLLDSDPKFIMRVAPLRYVASVIVYLWDLQKYNLAMETGEQMLSNREGGSGAGGHEEVVQCCPLTYIETPSINRAYATPGEGNVAADGVHLSSQGYAWWAAWIAECIVKKLQTSQAPDATGKSE